APSKELVAPLPWAFYRQGMPKPMPDLFEAIGQLNQHARTLVAFFTTFDALLMPSLGQRPLPIGTINTMAEDWVFEFQKAAQFTPFTVLWNVTGQPAISVPLYQGSDGLPLAVQLAGKPLGEDTLLALAAQLEAALPWAERCLTGAK